jgi:hypothetical protein
MKTCTPEFSAAEKYAAQQTKSFTLDQKTVMQTPKSEQKYLN